jgi:hypothetical protein
MNSSEKLDEIAPALVAAQQSLKNPRADSKARVQTKQGGAYEYRYLSLPALLEAVRTALKSVGLSMVQEIVGTPNGIGVTTRIVHLSGQWLETGPLVLPASGGPQEYGSSITYGRRYSLAAALGLAADEDDDAAKAQTSSGARETAGNRQRPPSSPPDEDSGATPAAPDESANGAGSPSGPPLAGGLPNPAFQSGPHAGEFYADVVRTAPDYAREVIEKRQLGASRLELLQAHLDAVNA